MFDATVWGTVGQWVSGLASSGALILGLSILQRDRRKEERDQARNISCLYERVETGVEGETSVSLHFTVTNNSNNDVNRLEIAIYGGPLYMPRWFYPPERFGGVIAQRLRPSETVTAKLVNIDQELNWIPVASFVDAEGKVWFRDLVTFRLQKKQMVIRRKRFRQGMNVIHGHVSPDIGTIVLIAK